jgi:hypothetical protein
VWACLGPVATGITPHPPVYSHIYNLSQVFAAFLHQATHSHMSMTLQFYLQRINSHLISWILINSGKLSFLRNLLPDGFWNLHSNRLCLVGIWLATYLQCCVRVALYTFICCYFGRGYSEILSCYLEVTLSGIFRPGLVNMLPSRKLFEALGHTNIFSNTI